MFSLLAMVLTILVLGSASLWRAVRNLPLARACTIFRGLLRSGATLIDRQVSSRTSLRTLRNRRSGMP